MFGGMLQAEGACEERASMFGGMLRAEGACERVYMVVCCELGECVRSGRVHLVERVGMVCAWVACAQTRQRGRGACSPGLDCGRLFGGAGAMSSLTRRAPKCTPSHGYG